MRRVLANLVRYRRWLVPFRMWLYGRRLRRLLPSWGAIAARSSESLHPNPEKCESSPRRVLVATSTGGHLTASSLDSLLAAALSVRGAQVEILLCDAALPVCMLCEKHILPDEARLVAEGPGPMCRHCYAAAAEMYERMGIRVRRLSDFLTEEDRNAARETAAAVNLQAISRYRFDDVPVGQQALAGTLRFYAVGDLGQETGAARMLLRYLEAAILTVLAGRRLLSEGYDAVILHHAIYVPQGVLADVARQAGARVVAWNTAYREGCFIFSHDETYHFTLIREDEGNWGAMPFPDAARERIADYLKSRRIGSQDWITYQRSAAEVTHEALGLDPRRPVIGLMTNIIWDAQLYYASNAFPSMKDWVLETIRWFARHPELQLAVRIHPAEIYNPLAARQLMSVEIANAFPVLPDNVVVVQPDNPLNSYALADLADTILIYGTKMGVELAAAGKPVIVAGEAWIRNKGIAYEASSPAEYETLLERLPLSPRHDPVMGERALKYAYHFFFRCMIPIAGTRSRRGWPPFEVVVERLEDLTPGHDAGLDIVCEGILEGTPFLWPAEAEDADASERAALKHARTPSHQASAQDTVNLAFRREFG